MRNRLQPVFSPSAAAHTAALAQSAGNAEAVDVLARTLWGEARYETLRSLEAVAAVIRNRAIRTRPDDCPGDDQAIVATCLRDPLFSCWNADAPNRSQLLTISSADPVFATCLRIARRAVNGALADPTGGATRYHARSVFPRWASGWSPCAEIGNLLFYPEPEAPGTCPSPLSAPG